MNLRNSAFAATAMVLALAGCKTQGDVVVEQGIGITALRSVCPAVGVADYTGDVTTFSPVDARTVDAMDVSAVLTNVRSTCNDTGEQVFTSATFDVLATRRNTQGARSVELPFFATVMRGGTNVVSKRNGTVRIDFADGASRAQASGSAGTYIDRAEATLPADIRERITRKREAGDDAAAIDPLTEPDVRAAVARASFELILGFQLTEEQLAYNATR